MKTLYNPFLKYSERPLLFVGVGIAAFGFILAIVFNARFDGLIDVHFADKTTLNTTLVDFIVTYIISILFLFAAAKITNTKTRIIDCINTVLLAKLPIYLLAFFNVNGYFNGIGESILNSILQGEQLSLNIVHIAVITTFSIVACLFLVWSVALLYNGYKVASNAKSTKSIVLFILALVISEIAIKIIIN